MQLSRESIQRMIGSGKGLTVGFGGSSSGGSGGGVSIPYYNQNFELLYKKVVTDATTCTVTTQYLTAAPNEIVNVGTETDPTTGDVTVTTIVGPKVKSALVIGDAMLVWDPDNHAIEVIGRDGTTAANLYATGGVSALGYSPGGGGGGGVSSLTDLLDVALSNPSNGQALVYDTSLSPAKWVNKTLFTGMSYSNNILSITIGGVTKTATIQSGSTSLDWSNITNKPDTATRWPSFSEVTNKPTTLSGYGITDAYISGGTIYLGGNSITPVTSLYGYATQDWVSQNYLALTGGTMTGLIVRTSSGMWVKGRDNAVIKQTDGGVSGHGWATVFSAKTLLGSWELGTISEQGEKLILAYTTDSDYNNDVNNASILFFPTGSGTLARLSDNVDSATKLQTARTIWGQIFDGTANISGGISGASNIEFTSITSNAGHGGYIDFHFNGASDDYTSRIIESASGTLNINYGMFVRGSTTYIGNSLAAMDQSYRLHVDGASYISNTAYFGGHVMQDGSYFLMHCMDGGSDAYGLMIDGLAQTGNEIRSTFGFHPAGRNISYSDGNYDMTVLSIRYNLSTHDKYAIINNYLNVGDHVTITSNNGYIQIGDGRIVWDSTNNAFQIIKSDGTAANLYTTGGVSALGMSAGVSSIDAMTFGNLTVNSQLKLPSAIVAGTSPTITQYANDSDCIYLFYDSAMSKINSKTYRFTQYDNVGIHGTDYNYGETWWIDPDGCALFQRLYLSNSVYIFTDGSNIKCRIGSNVYTLTKS